MYRIKTWDRFYMREPNYFCRKNFTDRVLTVKMMLMLMRMFSYGATFIIGLFFMFMLMLYRINKK